MTRPFYNQRLSERRYWDEYWQTMPREKLNEIHFRKIQKIIKFAYDNTTFYRRLYDQAGLRPEDVRNWDDFYQQVPFTDKPDYMKDQEGSGGTETSPPFAGEALPPEYRQYFFQTTGTTAVRLMGPHPELKVGTAVRLEVIGAARVLRQEGAGP